MPVPPLKGISVEELADADSQFAEIDGISIHYKQYSEGKPTFILLHGTLATTYTWREVIEPLAEFGTVIVYDRPAFGLSARPMPAEWFGKSPYGHQSQTDMLIALMDSLGIQRALLIGNSLRGGIAGFTAQRYPKRVEALVLAAPVQSSHGIPAPISWLFSSPQMQRIGPLLLRRINADFALNVYNDSWHDPTEISQIDVETYSEIFQTNDWDRGLWELIVAAQPFESMLQYESITVPTLIISGDDDQVLGTEENTKLKDKIPEAYLNVIPKCGHVPQEECPAGFMEAFTQFLSNLP